MSTRGSTGRKSDLSVNQRMAIKLLERHGEMTTYDLMAEIGTATMDSTRKMMRELRNNGHVYVSQIRNDKMAVWKLGNGKSVNIKDGAPASEVRHQIYKSEIARVKKDGRISLLVIDGVKVWSKADGVLI